MRIGGRHDRFDLGHRHEWKKAQEEQKEHREKSERSEKGKDVNHRGRVVSPAGRKKVAGQGGVCYDESLEPHSNVNENGDDPYQWNVFADFLKPEELRADHVAGNHDPVGPPVVSERPVDKSKSS